MLMIPMMHHHINKGKDIPENLDKLSPEQMVRKNH